jgi:hypothetical protein
MDLHQAAKTAPPALATDQVLFHVVHPVDANRDEWTQDYERAVAICAQFVRDYGSVHLHVETHRAGQYDAECLLRTEAG